MTVNPNGPMTAPLLGEARRFHTQKHPSNTEIYSVRVYAQDADGIKYVYPSPMKAAQDLLRYNLVYFKKEELRNDPASVPVTARNVLRAAKGKSQNKTEKHRYCGFEWYMCDQ